MRLFLGLVALLGLFAGAIHLQQRFVQAAQPGPATPGKPALAARAYGSDWARIVVGNPSEATPFASPDQAASTAPPRPHAAALRAPEVQTPGLERASPQAERQFQLVVQRNQTLSGICQHHYKTARKEVVEAVARHNRIGNVAEIREGQRLSLPPLETLLER